MRRTAPAAGILAVSSRTVSPPTRAPSGTLTRTGQRGGSGSETKIVPFAVVVAHEVLVLLSRRRLARETAIVVVHHAARRRARRARARPAHAPPTARTARFVPATTTLTPPALFPFLLGELAAATRTILVRVS